MNAGEMWNAIAVLVLIPVILLCAYLWFWGAISSVYWFVKTRRQFEPGFDLWADAKWYEKYVFGYFYRVLSVPNGLTSEGLESRQKALKGLRALGLGITLTAITLIVDINFTQVGSW